MLNSLSLQQKIGQLFFIGIAGPEIDGRTRELLEEINPGGICLFARNIRERSQTRELLDGLRAFLPVTPLLSVDQEGGLVDRVRRIMTPMPSAGKIKTPADAAQLGEIVGETLGILGFNMDFAPVVDVIDEERSKFNNGLFSRTFGRSKEDAAELAGEFLRSLQTRGIVGCLKHFPGLGASQVDSHEQLPLVDVSADELSSVDLFPYRKLLPAARAIMAAHAAFPSHQLQETDQDGKLLPASLSYNFVTKLLRDELQFDGVVITDDLEMGAILQNYGIGEASRKAVAAGADMLAICADPEQIREGYKAVLDAATTGEIAADRIEMSLSRIRKTKAVLAEPPPYFDQARLNNLSNEIAAFNERLNRE